MPHQATRKGWDQEPQRKGRQAVGLTDRTDRLASGACDSERMGQHEANNSQQIKEQAELPIQSDQSSASCAFRMEYEPSLPWSNTDEAR